MPCQFISSCFYLDIPWAKSDSENCNSKPAEAQGGPDQPAPVINQAPQPILGGGPPPAGGPAPGLEQPPAPPPGPAAAAAAQLQAANVEAPQARNGVEVVSTSPNGTPDKAAKARAAKTFRAYLPSQCHRTYSCVHCR